MPSKKVLEKVLLPEFAVSGAMDFFTYPLLKQQTDTSSLAEARKRIKELLKQHLTKR